MGEPESRLTVLRQRLANCKLVAIFRGFPQDAVLAIGEVLAAAGIRAFEVTADSNQAGETLKNLRKALGDEVLLGMGTVITGAELEIASNGRADFVVSPVLVPNLAVKAHEIGLLAVIGAMTPTEVLSAYQAGADLVKVFPANVLGPAYFKELQGPLGFIPTLATGGITPENFTEYLRAGAHAVGMGKSLVGEPNDWRKTLKVVPELADRILKALHEDCGLQHH
ncbi:bifunctional 4-hydroxy-2-oxoglutarate aldolase/2-dehydro-3-deoxy-phosphogluconate aldolase [Coprothermobacteraceae bacterium]|nr:bifunctional 4-hydroxy-2-oxoglutarate aldolase/2-dehydro-3-deoxy-phosphogluconate aldolase [Coprothermobacteraceae bacterium]